MEIQEGANQLFVGDESNPDAQIVFEKVDENTLEVTHTEVSESMQGKGAGGKLVDAMVNYARKQDKKLVAFLAHMPIISWQKTMIIKTFIKDKQKREIYGFPKRRYEKRTYRCVLQII